MSHPATSAPEGPTGSAFTWRQFQELPEEGAYRLELVRGVPVREPRLAPLHARTVSTLAWLLEGFARETGAGVVLVEAGFLLSRDPDTVRGPDVSFVASSRIPGDGYVREGFWPMAPDLAVEVLSPGNRASEMQEKVLEYLAAGGRQVWVVDPRLRSVTVHTPGGEARLFTAGAVLEGGEVLPGFRVPVEELFPG